MILERGDENARELMIAQFEAHRELREAIGYQSMMLQSVLDNIEELEIEDTGGASQAGVSSKLQLSLGGEAFGTGLKWVVDIDTGSASYHRLMQGLLSAERLADSAKEKLREAFDRALTLLRK